MKTKRTSTFSHSISLDIPSETDTVIINNDIGNIDISYDSSSDKIEGEAILKSFNDQPEVLDIETLDSNLVINSKTQGIKALDLFLTIPANMQTKVYNKIGVIKLENAKKPILADLKCGTVQLNNLYCDNFQIQLYIGTVVVKNIVAKGYNIDVNIGKICVDKKQNKNAKKKFNINIGNVKYL